MTSRKSFLCAAVTVAALIMIAKAGATPIMVGPLLLDPFIPDFSSASFGNSTSITNPYYPLTPGTTHSYRGEKEEDGETIVEENDVFVTFETRNILGVETIAVRDRAFENGLLVEETFDFYGQDDEGNVWYFGEEVTNFEYDDDGNLVGTNSDGSWIAGENGALPGYIMLANPTVGANYYQEFAVADEALDQALIHDIGLSLSIDFGDFDNVLQIFETTELDLEQLEFKYFAPGIGLMFVEEELDEALEEPGFTVELVSVTRLPEPSTLAALFTGLIFISGFIALRHRRLPLLARGRRMDSCGK